MVLPAYNEGSDIERNVIEAIDTFESFDYDYEIIVVDDGSSDSTYVFAGRAKLRHPERVRVVRYDENRGKGAALLCGARYASGEYIVFLDADMELHPRQLPLFFEIMALRQADAVIGSKWHPASRVQYPTVRRVYSLGYFLLIRLLFGLPLRDTQTGIKVFRSRLLQDVGPRLLEKRFAFDVELLAVAHRLKYRIVDAPVALDFSRAIGRLSLRTAGKMFADTFAIFYRVYLRRYYDNLASTATHGKYSVRAVEFDIDELRALIERERASGDPARL